MLYFNRIGAIHLFRHAKGVGESFDFVTKCDKGWVGCFCSVMSHFSNNSLFSKFCFIIVSLASF